MSALSAHRGPVYPRLWAVAVVTGTVMCVLVVRLAFLCVASADAAAGPVAPSRIEPQRGSIWDRSGALLATTTYASRAYLVPREMDEEDAALFVRTAAPLLGIDAAAALADPADPWVHLASDVPPSVTRQLRELGLGGLYLERSARRAYPLGAAASQLCGTVNAEGKAFYGLEERYDSLLAGRPGSPPGRTGADPRAYVAPSDGIDLVLTIDGELQLAAAAALERTVREQGAVGGTVVVMDPSSGAVLAQTSVPSFDPAGTVTGTVGLVDPAVSGIYEPGSVVKAVTIAAALDAGAITPESSYEDVGEIEYAGMRIHNWDRLAHGHTTITGLLQHSLNLGAVHVAQLLGTERFYASLAAFGFGAPTGVDLAGEVDGIVNWPTAGGDWYPGHLATNSFGQGIASTPLQVTAAFAALANDGRLMQPYVVASTVDRGGTAVFHQPRLVRQAVSPGAARTTRLLLEKVVSGKVTQAAVPGYSVGGKTGTSQIAAEEGYERSATIASFAGFLPVEQPRVVILVKIDRPHAVLGSEVAAPLFAEVARAATRVLGIPPDRPVEMVEAVR